MRGDSAAPLWAALESVAILSLLSIATVVAFTRLYERGLSRTQQTGNLFKIHSRAAHKLSRILLPFSSSSTRAIITKEYKVFSRDLTHTVQLALLQGLTYLYLNN
jgi:hypothetical protein